ncbi:MAG: hypothetical protein EPO52_11350 [Herbiconiux sp.]|uniref:hypothetical protein n=1 Tax=Herbiconiux sp. TaxID=1871186 RepID=UPI00120765BA|nr:hypothetical protein [Herbiconiux sp.]TAJ47463.1 MAG: hypothetical protein EPO52_11350 [Herbiconiux sp.]
MLTALDVFEATFDRSTIVTTAAIRSRLRADVMAALNGGPELSTDCGDRLFALGRQLVVEARSDEACIVLAKAFDAQRRVAGDPVDLAATMTWWARALVMGGRSGQAREVYAAAAECCRECGGNGPEATVRVEHARLLLDESDDSATAEAARGAEAVRDDPDFLGTYVEAVHLLGVARVRFGDLSGLADLEEALATATAAHAPWIIGDITLSQARCLLSLARMEDCAIAAAAFDEAGDSDSAIRARELAESARSGP